MDHGHIAALIEELRRLHRRPRVPAKLVRMATRYVQQTIHANFNDGETFARVILEAAKTPKKLPRPTKQVK